MAQGYAEQGREELEHPGKKQWTVLRMLRNRVFQRMILKRVKKSSKKDGRISRENQPSPKCKREGSSCSLATPPYPTEISLGKKLATR